MDDHETRRRNVYLRLRESASIRESPVRFQRSEAIAFLILTSRPSDGRGLGMDPGPPYAFKLSMFNVFCNSH